MHTIFALLPTEEFEQIIQETDSAISNGDFKNVKTLHPVDYQFVREFLYPNFEVLLKAAGHVKVQAI